MKKKFSFAAIMSLLTGRNLGGVSYEEACRFLEFLLNIEEPPYKKATPVLFEEARTTLSQEFPRFGDDDMHLAVRVLTSRLEIYFEKSPQDICDEWLSEQSARLGIGLHELIEVTKPAG